MNDRRRRKGRVWRKSLAADFQVRKGSGKSFFEKKSASVPGKPYSVLVSPEKGTERKKSLGRREVPHECLHGRLGGEGGGGRGSPLSSKRAWREGPKTGRRAGRVSGFDWGALLPCQIA